MNYFVFAQTYFCFCMTWELRTVFTFLNGREKINRGVIFCDVRLYEIQTSVSMKFIKNKNTAPLFHSFTCHPWPYSFYGSRIQGPSESQQRPGGPQNFPCLVSGLLKKKCLQIPKLVKLSNLHSSKMMFLFPG